MVDLGIATVAVVSDLSLLVAAGRLARAAGTVRTHRVRPRLARAAEFVCALFVSNAIGVGRAFGLSLPEALHAMVGFIVPLLFLRMVTTIVPVAAPIRTIVWVGVPVAELTLLVDPTGADERAWLGALLGSVAFWTGAHAFARAARTAVGCRKRLLVGLAATSTATGTGLLVVLAVTTLAGTADAASSAVASLTVGRVLLLGAGVGYAFLLAPPWWLLGVLRAPEIAAYRDAVLRTLRTDDPVQVATALEDAAGATFGGASTHIGLWDPAAERLAFRNRAGPWRSEWRDVPDWYVSVAGYGFLDPSRNPAVAQAHGARRAVLLQDPIAEDPLAAAFYRANNVGSVVIAPVASGDVSLGILIVLLPEPTIHPAEDLAQAQLLADDAGIVLERRALRGREAHVRAQGEAARLRADFLAGVAHDLRNPLGVLVGDAQFMRMLLARDPDAHIPLSVADRLFDNVHRASDLVARLLDAVRAESGQLVAHRVPVDLADAARSTATRIVSPARLEVDAPVPVLGTYDPVRIAQLVGNLCENAVKYSSDGGMVRVRVWSEAGDAHLVVADEGIGIPEADLPHVFDQYHRGRNTGPDRSSGTGLGLYICRGIVAEHGGAITVTSTEGAGTTFHVVLPLRAADAADRG